MRYVRKYIPVTDISRMPLEKETVTESSEIETKYTIYILYSKWWYMYDIQMGHNIYIIMHLFLMKEAKLNTKLIFRVGPMLRLIHLMKI